MNLSQVYRRSAAEFVEVVRGLPDGQLGAYVPGCPAWTVHDLLAHQAGSSTDLVSGNLDGVTTDPWTARQVDDRQTRTADELVAEWQANAAAVATLCDSITGPNPAWDVAVHLADLRESVGLPPGPAENGWGEVLVAAVGLLGERGLSVSIAEREADPGDTTWHFATAYGLWRAIFSRLDRATLEREVLRGDADAFARAAFLGD
ncbi:MAG: maleylpyruvate isomerase N-terminal domain-containing protein [Janthinobacterium lividum]